MSPIVRSACDRCHSRKLRCSGGRSPCDRCSRDGSVCVFSPAGKSGRPSKATQPVPVPQEPGNSSADDLPSSSATQVENLPDYLLDDLPTTHLPSLQPQHDSACTDPTQIPEFDFGAFLLLPDGFTDSFNLEEPTPSTEPAPREHLVYEMLEHLTRLQSRLLNHRASLSETSATLHSGGNLTVPLCEILDPFMSDTHQVADLVVYLNTQGSRFRHRSHLLKTISSDTSCLVLCAPVMLMLDLYKLLLALIDRALLEGKDRSLFTAAESPACSCCAPAGRVAFTDSTPSYLGPHRSHQPPNSAASSNDGPSTAPPDVPSAPTPVPNHRPTPILGAFAKLPEHLGGYVASTSSALSLSLRLWGLVGRVEYELSRLLQATRIVEDKFPLAQVGAPGVIPQIIVSMRQETDAVLETVRNTKSNCVVL